MIINKSGTVIRLHVDDIKETKNRATQGTKVIELKKRGDSIAHVCVVPRSDDEEEQENAELIPAPASDSDQQEQVIVVEEQQQTDYTSTDINEEKSDPQGVFDFEV